MSRDPHGWRRDGAALLVAAVCGVLVLLSLGPSLVGARVFASSDLILSYDPWRASQPAVPAPDNACVSDTVDNIIPTAAEFRSELLGGDIALWNNLASGGSPLASVPSHAVWSPLSTPYLVLPTWLAPAWVKLLELAVAIGGMFLLLRRFRLARAPALLGGLVFATSGFMVSWTNWPQTRTAAFLPLLLWSLERLIQLRSRRAVVPVALVLAAMLLGGFPAVTGYAVYLGAAYVLVRVLMTQPSRPRLRTLVRTPLLAAAGIALGALLVGFQLLPFAGQVAELNLESRAQSPDQHLPLLSLVTAALPNAFGSCAGGDYVGPSNQVEVNAYIGSAVLVLCAVAVLRRRRPEQPVGVRGFFVGATVVTVILGWVGGPLLELAQQLPVFSNNFVGRIRIVLGLCLAVLAAMGYDALLRASEQRRSRRAVAVEVAVWAGLAVVALAVVQRLRANLAPTGYLDQNDRHTLYAAIGVLIVLIAITLVRGRWRSLALGVIPVVVLVQALQVTLPYWPQMPRDEFYPRTPTHAFLADNLGSERFEGTGLTMLPGTNVYYDLRSLGGHSFTATTWRELMETADPTAFRTPTYSTLAGSLETAVSPALDRFSVRYLVVSPRQRVFGDAETLGTASGEVVVPAGGQLDVPLPGGPLRGLELTLESAPKVDGELKVEVRRGEQPVATSGRRLFPSTSAGPLPVAVTGEELPQEELVLRIRNTTSGPMSLAATASGLPVLTLIRPADDGLRVVHAASSATTWERTRALPRLRWASTARVFPQGSDRLQHAGSDPAAPGVVVLAADPAGASGAAATIVPVEDGPDAIEVDVAADGAGYLVVADGLQDGWTVTMDGQPAELLDADHALVAVAVPAGNHRVRLSYSPVGLRPGLVMSLLAGVTLAAIAVGGRRRRRSVAPVDAAAATTDPRR